MRTLVNRNTRVEAILRSVGGYHRFEADSSEQSYRPRFFGAGVSTKPAPPSCYTWFPSPFRGPQGQNPAAAFVQVPALAPSLEQLPHRRNPFGERIQLR